MGQSQGKSCFNHHPQETQAVSSRARSYPRWSEGTLGKMAEGSMNSTTSAAATRLQGEVSPPSFYAQALVQ
jgi:hypothetical protein